MQLSVYADIALYPSTALASLLDRSRGMALPPGEVTRFHGVKLETHTSGPDPKSPTVLELTTGNLVTSYGHPRLADLRGGQTTVSVLTVKPSGVGGSVEELLIVIQAPGTM